MRNLDSTEFCNWNEIPLCDYRNIIFGNGFSRTYWEKFSYPSLLSIYDDRPIGRYLSTRDIFKKLDNTSNFEEVLRAIYHAYIVSIDNHDAIVTLYISIRKALIEAVNAVHPKPNDVPSAKIGECLLEYSSVFTTNYDLIPYWSILNGFNHRFVDYFWNNKSYFDPQDVNVREGKIPIHYLHGALHLRASEISNARKIPIQMNNIIENAIGSEFGADLPLFITEGRSQLKLNRIYSNSYLRFCYERLIASSGGLVIYGHELSQNFDGHIVEAIKKSKNDKIAVSVFSSLTREQKMNFKYRVKEQINDPNKNVIFFESSTHPLSSCRL